MLHEHELLWCLVRSLLVLARVQLGWVHCWLTLIKQLRMQWSLGWRKKVALLLLVLGRVQVCLSLSLLLLLRSKLALQRLDGSRREGGSRLGVMGINSNDHPNEHRITKAK